MVELKSNRNLFRGLIAGAALALTATQAMATEGYFQLGFGPRQNAVGGAGVADSRDAMSAALNPAGIVGLPEQFQIGAALFMPYRGYTSTDSFVGDAESSSNLFLVPNMAYVRSIDATSSIGLTLYGNGGMNTDYKVSDVKNGTCPPGAGGVFCAGTAGVDLIQAFLSATYAHQMGNLKVGISPTIAVQRFAARGLLGFGDGVGAFGLSSDSNHLSDNGNDWSYGGGLRAGVEYEVSKSVRLGISGQTKMYMSKFSKYAGLFADGGDFDVPASITAGIAIDTSPDVTLMFDYQHIFYSGVAAVSNSSATAEPGCGCLGDADGPGFGWHDVDVFKFGTEWRYDKQWTLRAGYAYSTNPVGSADVMFNILAPGIVQHHVTGGVAYKLNDRSTIELSGMYVPESKVSGSGFGLPMTFDNANSIELHMHQYQFLAGWTYKM